MSLFSKDYIHRYSKSLASVPGRWCGLHVSEFIQQRLHTPLQQVFGVITWKVMWTSGKCLSLFSKDYIHRYSKSLASVPGRWCGLHVSEFIQQRLHTPLQQVFGVSTWKVMWTSGKCLSLFSKDYIHRYSKSLASVPGRWCGLQVSEFIQQRLHTPLQQVFGVSTWKVMWTSRKWVYSAKTTYTITASLWRQYLEGDVDFT